MKSSAAPKEAHRSDPAGAQPPVSAEAPSFSSDPSAELLLRPISSRNAFEETVERLAQAIRLRVVEEGERLPSERDLSRRLAVSRVTLREALRALERAGYVESRRGRAGGTFVVRAEPDLARPSERRARTMAREMGARLSDALDFRRVVEPGAAQLAAERARTHPAEHLRLLAKRAESTSWEDKTHYRAADSRLHLGIAVFADCPSLSAAVAEVQMRLTDLLNAFPWLDEAIEHANAQHREIVEAIITGRADDARSLMEEHVAATAALIRGFVAT
jgi:DNA-binding FadR family transcriptional regulator